MNQADRNHLHESSKSPQAASEEQFELTKTQQTLLSILVFVPLFVVIYFIGFWLRAQGKLSKDEWLVFLLTVSGVVLLKMMVFFWFGFIIYWDDT